MSNYINEKTDIMPDLESNLDNLDGGVKRAPVVILGDSSGSMNKHMKKVNNGIKELWDDLNNDTETRNSVEINFISFGGNVNETGFNLITNSSPINLTSSGGTPMAKALRKAFDSVEARKAYYNNNGIDYNRPFIFIWTDGLPTDMKENDNTYNEIKNRIEFLERGKHVNIFPVTIEKGNKEFLRKLFTREPLQLDTHKIFEFFQWMSNSIKVVSTSAPGQSIKLPDIDEWRVITS